MTVSKNIMFTIQERVNYYLGYLKDREIITIEYNNIQKSDKPFPPNQLKVISMQDIYILCKKQNDNFKIYGSPLVNIISGNVDLFRYKNKNILFRWGDSTVNPKNDDLFYITKARRYDSKNGVIMRMSVERHWKNIFFVKQNDMPFQNKKNILLWRGSTTGQDENSFENNRLLAVKTMIDSDMCDIGFTTVCQNQNPDRKLCKNSMSLNQQLKFKYLLSLEGNDVASGLKWQLYSNSIVFMRKPRIVSWAMEDKLEPFVHYIPLLDDFSDFKEKIEWANNNQDKCKEISANATNFIEQFLDLKKEKEIEKLVLEKYLSTVTINGN